MSDDGPHFNPWDGQIEFRLGQGMTADEIEDIFDREFVGNYDVDLPTRDGSG